MENQTELNVEVKKFFEQWGIYQKVIENDYMKHKEIAEILNVLLKYKKDDDGIKILDLGCGDANIISKVLKGKNVKEYVGVDLSKLALEFAGQNMENIDCKKCILLSDFIEKMSDLKDENKGFDYIITGYSLHHLTGKKKEKFFKLAKDLINKNGRIILYDLILKKDENKEQYLKRYFEDCTKRWCSLESNELDLVFEHMIKNDILENSEFLKQIAAKHSFVKREIKFKDGSEFFRFFIFE